MQQNTHEGLRGGQAAGRKMRKFRLLRQGFNPPHEKLKQELFAFPKTEEHGFPNQPSQRPGLRP